MKDQENDLPGMLETPTVFTPPTYSAITDYRGKNVAVMSARGLQNVSKMLATYIPPSDNALRVYVVKDF